MVHVCLLCLRRSEGCRDSTRRIGFLFSDCRLQCPDFLSSLSLFSPFFLSLALSPSISCYVVMTYNSVGLASCTRENHHTCRKRVPPACPAVFYLLSTAPNLPFSQSVTLGGCCQTRPTRFFGCCVQP
ncbi:hypothetical protein ASPZODRAFT_1667725 [Penicilliopsis zonata CBS 506.65]|uniref:Uncharacterized protein n=1 Tax=Penicilliopsis zonata CBS 506.65 TaxID=1073090 RepID=A0A1L9SNE8_9EURO|nr:hypothetical protein ASPZODRAFT_1667725 [Penicilliopsis zonata CBS 506.65]OJJ48755.1 hypothetical protein ASPZODRAFT_1667725 [Penicilliopsis zonata CBS 506.65]